MCRTFLAGVEHRRDRTILPACYAAGLRISEAVHLKIADIDGQCMVIRVLLPVPQYQPAL